MFKSIVAIYDQKASLYSNAVCLDSVGVAKRQFSDQINDPSTPFGKHPHDYTLMEIGQFDDQSGIITALSKPNLICNGHELVISKD